MEEENATPETPTPEATTPEPTNGAVESTPEVAPTPEGNDQANDPALPPTPDEPTGTEAAPGEIPAESPVTAEPKEQIIEEAERFAGAIGTYTSFELTKAKEVILKLLAVIKSN